MYRHYKKHGISQYVQNLKKLTGFFTDYRKNISLHIFRTVKKLFCDGTDENKYFTQYRNLTFYAEMSMKVKKNYEV